MLISPCKVSPDLCIDPQIVYIGRTVTALLLSDYFIIQQTLWSRQMDRLVVETPLSSRKEVNAGNNIVISVNFNLA